MTSVEERLKLKRAQIDTWSIRERLCLASSVLRSGDQHWMSVSRSLKAFGETGRPPDWFSQKSCAVQYSNLLENVETPKRKKRTDKGDTSVETPSESIVRRLTQERIEELKRLLNEDRKVYAKLKEEVRLIKTGCADDRLDEMYQEIEEEKLQNVRKAEARERWLKEREEKKKQLERAWKPTAPPSPLARKHLPKMHRRNSSQSDPSSEAESAQDSPQSEHHNVDAAGEENVQETHVELESAPTPTSPLLTSLLKSPSPAPTSQGSSILHSAITSHRGASPTITSLLSSAPGVPVTLAPPTTVSPSLKNLVSNAIGSEQPHHQLPPHNPSPAAGAPTLSMLLELPPSLPGKPLPELPSAAKTTTVLSSSMSPNVSPASATVVTTREMTMKTETPTVSSSAISSNIISNKVQLPVNEVKVAANTIVHDEIEELQVDITQNALDQQMAIDTKKELIDDVLIEEVVVNEDSVIESELLSSQNSDAMAVEPQNSDVVMPTEQVDAKKRLMEKYEERLDGEIKSDKSLDEVIPSSNSHAQKASEISTNSVALSSEECKVETDIASTATNDECTNSSQVKERKELETLIDTSSKELISDIGTEEKTSNEAVSASVGEVTTETVAEMIEISGDQDTTIQTEEVGDCGPCIQELEDMEVIILDKVQELDEVQIVEDMKELECEVVEVVMGSQENVESMKEETDATDDSVKSEVLTLAETCSEHNNSDNEVKSTEQFYNPDESKPALNDEEGKSNTHSETIETAIEISYVNEENKDMEEENVDNTPSPSAENDFMNEDKDQNIENIAQTSSAEESSDERQEDNQNFDDERLHDESLLNETVDKSELVPEVLTTNSEAEESKSIRENVDASEIGKDDDLKEDSVNIVGTEQENMDSSSNMADLTEIVSTNSITEVLSEESFTKDVEEQSPLLKEESEKDIDELSEEKKYASEQLTKNGSHVENLSKEDELLSDGPRKDDLVINEEKEDSQDKTEEDSVSSNSENGDEDKPFEDEPCVSKPVKFTSKEIAKEFQKGSENNKKIVKEFSKKNVGEKANVIERETTIETETEKERLSVKDTGNDLEENEESVKVSKDSEKEDSEEEGSEEEDEIITPKDTVKKVVQSYEDIKKVKEISRKEIQPPKKDIQVLKKDIQSVKKDLQIPKKVIQTPKRDIQTLRKDIQTSRRDIQTLRKYIYTPKKEIHVSQKEVIPSKKELPVLRKDQPLREGTKENQTKREMSRRETKEDITRREEAKRSVFKNKKEKPRDEAKKRNNKEIIKKVDESAVPETKSERSKADFETNKDNIYVIKKERTYSKESQRKGEEDKNRPSRETKFSYTKMKSSGEEITKPSTEKGDEKESQRVINKRDVTVKEAVSEKDEKSEKFTPSIAAHNDEDRKNDVETPKVGRKRIAAVSVSESVPSSPASITDEEREYKSWKKSIMLLYGRLATHKYASLFLRPITDDQAPGYSSVVHRPIDLMTIKRNIETGVIRTTVEFQRDIMLMFLNSIMYNKSSHLVHKMAKQMQQEGMQHIQDYLTTQMLVQVVGDSVPIRRETRTTEANKQRDFLGNPSCVPTSDESDGSQMHKRKRNTASDSSERGWKKKKVFRNL